MNVMSQRPLGFSQGKPTRVTEDKQAPHATHDSMTMETTIGCEDCIEAETNTCDDCSAMLTQINGIVPTNIDELKEALSYLNEPYNGGSMWFACGDVPRLCIKFRSKRAEHWGAINANDNLHVATIASRNGQQYIEVMNQ